MKKAHCQLLLGILISLFPSFQVKAEDKPASGWTPSATLRSVVADRYPAYGSGAVLYDDSAIQTDLNISFRNGFWIDLWNSTPLKSKWNKDFGTEQDLGIGWNGKLKDIGINIGTTYFDEPKLEGTVGDSLYSRLFLSKEFKYLSVAIGFENYTTMPNSGFQGGNLYSIGGNKSLSFWKDKLCFSTSLALVYDDGAYGFDEGLLLRGSVEFDWKITDRLTLILPQILYYAPLTVHDSRKLDAFYAAGFCWKF